MASSDMTRDELDGVIVEKLLEMSEEDDVTSRDNERHDQQALPLGVPKHLLRQFDYMSEAAESIS